eukprot:3855816-Rhodomonas_salina.1
MHVPCHAATQRIQRPYPDKRSPPRWKRIQMKSRPESNTKDHTLRTSSTTTAIRVFDFAVHLPASPDSETLQTKRSGLADSRRNSLALRMAAAGVREMLADIASQAHRQVTSTISGTQCQISRGRRAD